MYKHINYKLPLTLEQAQEVIEARSNGGYEINDRDIASPNGEWCLAELEAFVVKRRTEENFRHDYHVLPPIDGVAQVQDPHFGYTPELAQGCVEDFIKERAKGAPMLHGVDTVKGGRAWLEGHWTVPQLESVCAHLRFICGDQADGLIETIALWEHWKVIETYHAPQTEEEKAFQDSYRPLIIKMLTAGINPQAFPRPWEEFLRRYGNLQKLPRIVCAANEIVYREQTGQIRKLVVAGARHCDQIMGGVTMALEARHGTMPNECVYISEDQGFIDNFGNYWTRQEAWTIAEFHQQIVLRQGWLTGQLHSENLY